VSNKASERAIASMSESTRKRNPHLFGAPAAELKKVWEKDPDSVIAFRMGIDPKPGKRLRQDTKPLMNKLEQSFFNYLKAELCNEPTLRAQAKRYKLANGAWYKPDITANVNGFETAWECKGPKQMKNMARAMLVIKFSATQWPDVRWKLVWKDGGQWKQQDVLP
jgi:hypothetical protein